MTEALGPLSINGWTIYHHSLFDARFRELVRNAKKRREKDPERYLSHPETKLLAHIQKAIHKDVPQDPGASKYQISTPIKGWCRVKIGRRYRLFFRFHSERRVIIYCWLNDEDTLRKSGASTDPYAVFAAMVASGNPPRDFDALLRQVQDSLQTSSID